MKFINRISKFYLIPVLLIAFVVNINAGVDPKYKGNSGSAQPSLIANDAYRLFINNIDMPMNRLGVMANVAIAGRPDHAEFDGVAFLFSGGFFLSGYENGKLWSNGVASASRIEDYVAGTATSPNDPKAKLYILKQLDGDFAASWTEWKDAVALGAYFYDGDGDGVYNPVDLNGNGKWDKTEDRPDLLGDETIWCVYTDAKAPSLRRFVDIEAKGIEIRQTVFAFQSKGVVGNMVFLRYSIVNRGTVAERMDSVIFGVWADPDLGDYADDLVGSDLDLNAGYVYNDGDDPTYGTNPPTFLIDFFQGPITYVPGETFTDNNGNGKYDDGIDTPIDTAYDVRGQVRGVVAFPGAKNLGISSFVHYMQSHPTQGDPNFSSEARYYMEGRDRTGATIDPCTWSFGTVLGGVDCATVNGRFMYSGDPVTSRGWINSTAVDQRQMQNVGPFILEKDKPVDVVVAYVVGRGTSALNSITVTKANSKTAQLVFDNNFPSPPPPPPVSASVTTSDKFFDVLFPTSEQFNYNARDTVLDINRKVKGFYVTAYRTNVKQPTVNGVKNSVVVADYQLADSIKSLYVKLPNGGIDLKIEEVDSLNRLLPEVYKDAEQGRLRVRFDKDPFTGTPLIKGKDYYFTITTYTLNHSVIVNRATNTYGPLGDYIDNSGGAVEEYETAMYSVTMGENTYNPMQPGVASEQQAGTASGRVKYLVVDPTKLTGDSYAVEFFEDTKDMALGNKYKPYYRIKKGSTVLMDSSKNYDFDTTKISGKLIDGFVVKVEESPLTLATPVYKSSKATWYTNFDAGAGTGVFYVGKDIPQSATVNGSGSMGTKSTLAMTAPKARSVDLRFGTAGKAYRYIVDVKGTAVTRRGNFAYAAAITNTDTAGGRSIGKFGEGFVDVPFTAWVNDSKFPNDKRQLATAFIERGTNPATNLGTPDGVWDPGTQINNASFIGSQEWIVIFDREYDPNGADPLYSYSAGTVYADIMRGYNLPSSTAGLKNPADTAVAKQPWFNAMYVVGLQRKDATQFYSNGDTLKIGITNYPYTSSDAYSFKTLLKGDLTTDQKKSLFEKVNVFPNPLFAYNPATSYSGGAPDEPFVTFSNLPTDVTIKIFSTSGVLVKELTTADKSSPTSPFLRWDLENDNGLRVASGMYIAIVSSPGFGEKVLKFGVIMPQKQIRQF